MYFRLNRSLFRILLWFLRVGFMRFGDLLVFNRDFWGYVILGFDWGFVRFCPNGGSEDFKWILVNLVESSLKFLVVSRVELL